jgi:hypothetical protein
MLFGPDGITSYKAKMLLLPELCGNDKPIVCPWNHMTESLEKSNHAIQRYSQTHTMRFGGGIYNEEPTFQDLWYSFATMVDVAKLKDMDAAFNICSQITHKCNLKLPTIRFQKTYLEICRRQLPIAKIDVGHSTPLPLLGMHFVLIGTFKGKGDPPGTPTSAILQEWIKELGGFVLDRQKASRILHSHTTTPHCYVIIKNDEELRLGTSYAPQPGGPQQDSGKNRKKSKTAVTAGKKPILSRYAIACRTYADGDFVFLNWNFIADARKTHTIVNPNLYKLQPGPRVRRLRVKELMPLFIRQCDPTNRNIITARTALKRFRRKALRTIYENARK